MASQLKKRREFRTINGIKDGVNEYTDQKSIKRSFLNFYAKLFQKKVIKKEEIEKFLDRCNQGKVPYGMVKILNESIITIEIDKAIYNAKTGKTLSLDGFSARYIRQMILI